MAEAQSQMNAQQHDLSDYTIALLGALLFGATVAGTLFGLIAGYQYAATEFLNIYPPEDALLAGIIDIAYIAGPILLGLLATVPAYKFLLKLK